MPNLATGPWSAILVTSANAARAIAGHKRRDELRRIPVFAVGKQSAQALRAAGFAEVTSADGDADDLAALVAARLEPPARLLYLAGEDRAGDLAGALRAKNFIVDTVVVYRAVAAATLPPEAAAALAGSSTACCIFRAAAPQAFLAAARQTGLLEAALGSRRIFVCRHRMAEPLTAARGRECAHRGAARRGGTHGIMRLNQRDYAVLLGFDSACCRCRRPVLCRPRGWLRILDSITASNSL